MASEPDDVTESGDSTIERRAPLRRAMRVIRWMVEQDRPSFGVREIARALDVAPSTAHQLLAMMEDASIVERDPVTKRYSWTLEFYRIASMLAEATYPISTAALPLCRRLAGRTSEAIYVGLYDANRAAFMYVEYIESLSPVNYIMALYEWIPLCSGAGTMSILAFLPPDEVTALLPDVMRRREIESLPGSTREIKRQLAEIREAGYVVSVAQRIVGAAGIGAPILGPKGKLLGNVVLALPEERLARYDAHWLGHEVSEVAHAISQELGGHLHLESPS